MKIRRIAVNIAKLPELLRTLSTFFLRRVGLAKHDERQRPDLYQRSSGCVVLEVSDVPEGVFAARSPTMSPLLFSSACLRNFSINLFAIVGSSGTSLKAA
jgi:hypothetical protein